MKTLDILVVDDERDLAFGVADLLEVDGHRVILAHSAEAALDLARARAFDMVFLDVKLPGLTGFEILLPLRRALPRKRIVPMTGYRIDNLIATVVGDENFTVLSAPATEPQVFERLQILCPGGMLVVLDTTGMLGRRLADYIEQRGEAVCLARADVEVLEATSISGSDVLILDLGRTIAHSLEAYLEVREGGSNPKVIVVARNPGGAKAAVNPLQLVSVTGCLFKPFDPEDLLAIVSDLACGSAPPQLPVRATGQ